MRTPDGAEAGRANRQAETYVNRQYARGKMPCGAAAANAGPAIATRPNASSSTQPPISGHRSTLAGWRDHRMHEQVGRGIVAVGSTGLIMVMPRRVQASPADEAEQQAERELVPPLERLDSDGVVHKEHGRHHGEGCERPEAGLALVRVLQQEGETAVAHASGAARASAPAPEFSDRQARIRANELSESAGDEHTAGDADSAGSRREPLHTGASVPFSGANKALSLPRERRTARMRARTRFEASGAPEAVEDRAERR